MYAGGGTAGERALSSAVGPGTRRMAAEPISAGPSPGGRMSASDGFAECYAANYRGLATQLYVYTGDLGLAQELVQEAFCRALARWAKLSSYDDPVAWVRRVAFNLANSRWQRARVAMRYLHGQRERHVEGPSPDRVAAIAALARLPEGPRRAVVLHYLADLSIADIATQEGVAIGTVKSWLHRGRTALAGLLADGEGRYV